MDERIPAKLAHTIADLRTDVAGIHVLDEVRRLYPQSPVNHESTTHNKPFKDDLGALRMDVAIRTIERQLQALPELRRAIEKGLPEKTANALLPHLVQLFETSQSPDVRDQALHLITLINTTDAYGTLEKAATEETSNTNRKMALNALSDNPHPDALMPVHQATRDPDGYVRQTAFKILLEKSRHADLVATRALEHDDPVIQGMGLNHVAVAQNPLPAQVRLVQGIATAADGNETNHWKKSNRQFARNLVKKFGIKS